MSKGVGGGYIVRWEVGGRVGKNTARDGSSPRWNSRRQTARMIQLVLQKFRFLLMIL